MKENTQTTYLENDIKELHKNNNVVITGTVMNDFKFSHKVFGEKFYTIYVSVNRLSKVTDEIPVMVTDRMLDVTENLKGKRVHIEGQYRSYNYHEDNDNRLILSIFARDIQVLEDVDIINNVTNQIFLDGYVCKEPIYRKTPLGREISDIMLAVNRTYGKSDYIPCVAWGRNARYSESLSVGDRIQIVGRVQSRKYEKRLSDGRTETRTAYEISINTIEKI